MTEPAFSTDERELLRNAREFESLVNHPGFKLLQDIVQKRIRNETNNLIQPQLPDGMDGLKITKLEDRQKGAIFGMLLTIGIPSATIDQSRQLIQSRMTADSDPATEGKPNASKAP